MFPTFCTSLPLRLGRAPNYTRRAITGQIRMTSLSPEAANAKLRAASAVFLDVRTASEFAQGHVPDALHVPVTKDLRQPNAEFVADVVARADGRALIVGCKAGKRSTTAIGRLRDAGFEPPLFELEGGFDAWLDNSDLPVEK